MAIFTIAPVNSLSFIRRNTNPSSFENTLYQQLTGFINKEPYCQKVINGETLTIQVKTDYTSVTAGLYNTETGAITSLSPAIVTSYTNWSFWEIPITINTNGYYKVFIYGTLSGYENITFESESLQVADSWDGVTIEFYNSVNTGYVDYSTEIVHTIHVFTDMKLNDIGGTDIFYDNFGKEERVYGENETIHEIVIEAIPYYLVQKIIYASRLDTFIVNGVNYIVKESHSITQHPGSLAYDLDLLITEANVPGINCDYDAEIVLS